MLKTRRIGTKLLSMLLAVMLVLSTAGGALAVTPQWADGSYNGAAQGRNGQVEMCVTIAGGQITGIDAVNQSETAGLLAKRIRNDLKNHISSVC